MAQLFLESHKIPWFQSTRWDGHHGLLGRSTVETDWFAWEDLWESGGFSRFFFIGGSGFLSLKPTEMIRVCSLILELVGSNMVDIWSKAKLAIAGWLVNS